jgi:hypothetical protein
VVRAIGNIIGLRDDAWVLDPFCGSGTTLLECAHVGWNALGVDRNPLAIQIANAKLHAVRNADRLVERSKAVLAELAKYRPLSSQTAVDSKQIRRLLGDAWERDVPAFQYLAEWFSTSVLAQMLAIRRALVRHVRRRKDRQVYETILSDQLRDASLQDPADLRIRRRKDTAPNYPLIEWFEAAMNERLGRVLRAQAALGTIETQQSAVLGDNRSFPMTKPSGGFDAVICSPPYETALPYIDTQRLSLVFFGHIAPNEIQATERELTGCREISRGERGQLESIIAAGDPLLPREVVELCRELLHATRGDGNGFRKQNRPALVYRYFRNMAAFFRSLRPAMRPGANVALVVGPSRTTLSGREYTVDTPSLLSAVACRYGYGLKLTVAMDTYQRFDLHQRNSIDSETLSVYEVA